jgi:hypothetical protein
LAMEEDSEPKTVPVNHQEIDREEVRESDVREQGKSKEQTPKPMRSMRPEEGTAEWVLWMLHRDMEKGRKMLEQWTRRGRKAEATLEAAEIIRGMGQEEGLEAVKELRGRKQWVRRINNASVMVPTVIETLTDKRGFAIEALLDCGATGCYIDKGFAIAKNLPMERLPRPIPVYNADGTHNEGGPINHTVTLRVRIKDHIEVFPFAVTNTGKTDLIVGFNWLQKHNPQVNWKTGDITFDRCPLECGVQLARVEEAEEAEEVEELEEGDRLLVTRIHDQEKEWIASMHTHSQRMAEGAQKEKMRKTLEEMVPAHYLEEFREIFEKSEFDKLPERRRWDHAIEIKPGAEPFTSKVYPLNLDEQKRLDEFLEENLQSGRIRPSKSPIASPFFFIKKKDGSLRPVQDYRKLNAMTIKNRYPLPLISEVIHRLRHARIFTKLDIRWGYNNVRIKEGDEHKAAFTTNRGLFEPLVMFFGLTNSPATFQTMMNDIFRELINEGHVIVYMDDIMIFSKDMEEHRRVVKRVLSILHKHNLYLKPEKCEFEKEKVEYLGLVVSEGMVEMDPVKVEGVSKWPVPGTKSELQQFLGFINFYRRFVQNFASIAKPLHTLTGNKPWTWGPDQQTSFQTLKDAVTAAPTLAFPTDEDQFRVEADSSDFATGAVLSQLQQEVWKPVAYMSKALNEVERNYEVHDKEMLAIMRALEEWRQYLQGARQPFEIWTDHKNLEYFMTARKLNRRQARWSLELADYDFILRHRPGQLNKKADLLSRRKDHQRGVEEDNAGVTMLKQEFLRDIGVDIGGSSDELLDRIRKSKNVDGIVKEKVEKKEKDWEEEDGIITWEGRVYVPKDKKLRDEVIHLHHDTYAAGHPGRFKTAELILRNYWWPRIQGDVRAYVDGCNRCQQTKTFPAKPMGKLSPNKTPQKIWQYISVDLITQLPPSLGHDAIMVVVDRLSKRIRLAPTNGEVTSEGVARIFRDTVWRDFGLPEVVISDRGSQFVSNFTKDLYRLLGIKMNPSTAYHPQTDGQTERINQEVEQYLRLFVNYRQDDWVEWLPLAEFSYNDKIQSSTGYSPFYLNYGQHPRKSVEPRREVKTEAADVFEKRMKKIREEAAAAMEKAAKDMKKYYDKGRQDAPKYEIGDQVYLEGLHISTNRPSKKLEDRRYGPFRITAKIGERAYKLQLPLTWKRIHPVFNTVLLRPARPSTSTLQQRPTPPPPIMTKEGEEYEVEKVLDSRVRRGRLQYLVKWTGFPREENSWVPARNMRNAKKKVQEFHRQAPSAPQHVGHTYHMLHLQPHYPMPSCEQMRCESTVHYTQGHGTVTWTST